MGINSLLSVGFGLIFASIATSTNYHLNSYSLDGGSTNNATSTTYKLNATSGDTQSSTNNSPNYQTKSGTIQTQQSNVPLAPTLSNGGGTYTNKLNFIINTAGNPTDTTYSVAVSTTSNFASTSYVQADGTLNTTPIYQTYTAWGGATGTLAIGLAPGTAYWFKTDAIQGKFTATSYGPSATATTSSSTTPSLSFSVTPNSLSMGSLLVGLIITSSTISFTYATNATNGGAIYMAGASTGLVSASSGGYSINVSPPSGNLATLAEGFGLQALTASSPLASQSPYNGTSNIVGSIYTTFQPVFSATSAVTTGTATAAMQAKSSISTPSSTDYTDTLTFVAAASF